MTHVLKFGGTSVGSAEALESVVRIIRERAASRPVVVVVSALSGVTTALAEAAAKGDRSIVRPLGERHSALLHALTRNDWNGSGPAVHALLALLELRLRQPSSLGSPTHDEILGIGERLTAPLVAEVLTHRGLRSVSFDATTIVRTDHAHGEASVDLAATRKNVLEAFAALDGAIPVITGFVGATASGVATTLGRGGSDITAGVIGAALDADEVEIWSDVDGIYSRDPRLGAGAVLHERLTPAEAFRLAAEGARVLHPGTIAPLHARGVRLSIRNTFRPEKSGTRIERRPPAELVIAGATGNVGSALVRQLHDLRLDGVHLRIAANSRVSEDARDGTSPTDWAKTIARLGRGTIFVDVTASADVAALYEELLERGIGIVTANKLAGSGDGETWRRLRRLSSRAGIPLRYETTVGAALPVLRTARELAATDDRLLALDAVLSGTLSYVLARVNAGISFEDALGEAKAKGMTEPDPAADLSGRDVASKLVILLRELGVHVSLGDVSVRPLTPDQIVHGRRFAYVGSWTEGVAKVGLREVAEDDPLSRLRAGENIVVFRTARYDHVPLTVAGPGAGPAVTAAGVLAEILEVASA